MNGYRVSLLMIISIFFSMNSFAFLENTHIKISSKAFFQKKLFLDSKAKDIGLENGVMENLNGYYSEDWIIKGAAKEDDNPLYLNHFYNPLTDSGLHDTFSGKPSYEWANTADNEWAWSAAREKYHLSLKAATNIERMTALAGSFRALGQNMHLVQDLAAPAHVRNDAHPTGDGFEAYTNQHVGSLNFSSADFAGPRSAVAPFAPRQLWDSDQYDGTNSSTSTAIGLAEYTNANFASEDTIFTENTLDDWNPLNNKHYFPFPRQEDTVVFAESQNRTLNGFAVYRKYFDKVGGGQTIRHFATASRLYEHLLDDPEPSIQGFDDRCYKDYADLLIPRAVGYSTALLDYFFRGQIDMVADSGNSGQYVIKNESDENMSGTFRLYYDDKYDMRKLVPAADWNLSIAANGKSSPVTFAAPSDAKEPGKYLLVFLGVHGAESGAVVGKIVELKSGPDARVVTVSNYWTNRGYIRANVNNKQISASMPAEGLSSINSVRFDVNDWNTFVVMATYYHASGECKSGCKEFHKFTIDGNDLTINYGGLLLRENYIYNYSSEKVYSYVWPDSARNAGRNVNGVEEYSLADGIKIYLNKGNRKDINYVDFFLLDGNIKPFGTIEESSYSRLYYYGCTIWGDGEWACDYTEPNSPILEDNKKINLYYGNNIAEIVNSNCNGGYYSSGKIFPIVTECQPKTKIDSYFIPLSIFNKNDYAYNIYKNYTTGSIISTLSTEISKNQYGYIKSLLRNDGNYSFYADSKYYITNKFYSYSSEAGILPCSLDLVSQIKYNGKYVGWNKYDGLILLTSCSDIERLNKAKVYVDDVFDVFIK